MPKITIQAYAALGDMLGSRNVEIFTSANTVNELIDFLSERYDLSFKEKLIDPQTNELQRSYRILVNDCDIDSLSKLMTPIRNGDKIIFFPPVSGG